MRYQTIETSLLSAFVLAMGLALFSQPAGAAEQCPLKVAKSRPLTGNVDCSTPEIRALYPSGTPLNGVEITKNGVMLDCNGYSIIGPDTQTQINNHTTTEHYGIRVLAKRNVIIKNCINVNDSATSIADGSATGIKYWERGIYLEDAVNAKIYDNRIHHNTRYGEMPPVALVRRGNI